MTTKQYLQLFLLIVLFGMGACNRKVARNAQKTGGLQDACNTLSSGGEGSSSAGDDSSSSPFGETALFLNPEGINPSSVGKVDMEAVKVNYLGYQGLFSIPSISIRTTGDMAKGNVETVFVQVTSSDGQITYPKDPIYGGFYRPFSGILRLGCMKDLVGKKVNINFIPCVHGENLIPKRQGTHGYGYVCFDEKDEKDRFIHRYSHKLDYSFFASDYKDLISESDREQIIDKICTLEQSKYEGNINVAVDLKNIADDYLKKLEASSSGSKLALTSDPYSIEEVMKIYSGVNGIGPMVAELETNTPFNYEKIQDAGASEQASASLRLTQGDASADCADAGNSSSTEGSSGDDGTFDPYGTSSTSSDFGEEYFPSSSSSDSDSDTTTTTTGGDSSTDTGTTSTNNDTTGDEEDSTADGDGTTEEESTDGPNPSEATFDSKDGKSGLFIAIGVSVFAFTAAGAAITNNLGWWGESIEKKKIADVLENYNRKVTALKEFPADGNLQKLVDEYNDALFERAKLDPNVSSRVDLINDLNIKSADDFKKHYPEVDASSSSSPRVLAEVEYNKRSIDLDTEYKGKRAPTSTDVPESGRRWKSWGAIFGYLFVTASAAFVASSYSLALTDSNGVEDDLVTAGNKKIELEKKLKEMESENSDFYRQVRANIEEARE